MIFFMHDTRKANSLLLLLFLPGAILFSMDIKRTVSAGLYKDFSFKPQKSLTVFDPKKAVEMVSEWEDIVPQSVMITPDDKGVLLCYRGKVSYASFDVLSGMAAKPIIEHAQKHFPIIAATLKEGSLLVVSAMNYKHPETAKPVSEYIECWNGTSKIPKKLSWPVQAMTFFNTSPKIMVMASPSFIVVIDLATGTEYEKVTFRPLIITNDWIADVAMNQDDTMMLIAGALGSIQLIKVEKQEIIKADKRENKIDLSHLNWVVIKDAIKEIFYPSIDTLLYRTDKGEVKVGSIYHVIEPKSSNDLISSHKINYVNVDEPETSSTENVDTRIFSYSMKYDSASIDPSEGIAAVHWSSNSNADKKIRHNVKIYQGRNRSIEKYILKLSPVEEKCSYIENGRRQVRNWTVVTAAIRNDRVVVLGDDGKLRIHTLPKIERIQEGGNQNVLVETSQPFHRDTIKMQKTRKRRSLTYSGGDAPFVEDRSPIDTGNLPKLGQLPEQCAAERDKEKKERRVSVSPSYRGKGGGKDKLHSSEPSKPVSVASEQTKPVSVASESNAGDSLQRTDSSGRKKPSPRNIFKGRI